MRGITITYACIFSYTYNIQGEKCKFDMLERERGLGSSLSRNVNGLMITSSALRKNDERNRKEECFESHTAWHHQIHWWGSHAAMRLKHPFPVPSSPSLFQFPSIQLSPHSMYRMYICIDPSASPAGHILCYAYIYMHDYMCVQPPLISLLKSGCVM